MAQSRALVETLKRSLRAQRITYADIAAHLEMSEANVKRLFATQSFTLQRLEAICEMMKMDLSDLFGLLESERRRIRHLTWQQKKWSIDTACPNLKHYATWRGWTGSASSSCSPAIASSC